MVEAVLDQTHKLATQVAMAVIIHVTGSVLYYGMHTTMVPFTDSPGFLNLIH